MLFIYNFIAFITVRILLILWQENCLLYSQSESLLISTGVSQWLLRMVVQSSTKTYCYFHVIQIHFFLIF